MSDRILRRREVEHLTGLSCSTIYDWMKSKRFPPAVQLGSRTVGWRESDVAEWIEDRDETKRLADYYGIDL